MARHHASGRGRRGSRHTIETHFAILLQNLPRHTKGSSGYGQHGDEPFGQHARARQCGYPYGSQGHERDARAQSDQRESHQCADNVPGTQHIRTYHHTYIHHGVQDAMRSRKSCRHLHTNIAHHLLLNPYRPCSRGFSTAYQPVQQSRDSLYWRSIIASGRNTLLRKSTFARRDTVLVENWFERHTAWSHIGLCSACRHKTHQRI